MPDVRREDGKEARVSTAVPGMLTCGNTVTWILHWTWVAGNACWGAVHLRLGPSHMGIGAAAVWVMAGCCWR